MRLRRPNICQFAVNCPSWFSRQQWQFRRQFSPSAPLTAVKSIAYPHSQEEVMRPSLHPKLRGALVNLAQDLIDLSEYLATADSVLRTLHNQKSRLGRLYIRAPEEDTDSKSNLKSEMEKIDELVESMRNQINNARQHELPPSEARFYLRLKNLHARILFPKIQYHTPGKDGDWEVRQTENALTALLSLPMPNVLQELALHLLSTCRPFSQKAFFIMVRQLSGLRYASAARSAYFHLINAGYPPDSPKAISLLLTLAPFISNHKEFTRLRKLVAQSNMAPDAHIYGALVAGSVKMGHTTNAKRYLQAMEAAGITPNVQVLTILLRDSASRRHWQSGEKTWQLLKASSIKSGASIDALAYHEMWRLCRRCRQIPMARSIFREALGAGFGPRDITMRPPIKRHPVRRPNKFPALRDFYQSIQSLVLSSHMPQDPRENAISHLPKIRQVLQSVRYSSRQPVPAHWEEMMSFSIYAEPQLKRLQTAEPLRHRRVQQPPFSLQNTISNEPPEPVQLSFPGLFGPSLPTGGIDDEHVSDIIEEASQEFIASAIRMSTNSWPRRRTKSLSDETLSYRLRLIARPSRPTALRLALPIGYPRRPKRSFMRLHRKKANARIYISPSRRSGHRERRERLPMLRELSRWSLSGSRSVGLRKVKSNTVEGGMIEVSGVVREEVSRSARLASHQKRNMNPGHISRN
jgi:hypothetical protein